MDRQSDILLESGTNELGVMEFTIGGEIFGINVAKVLEIMMACPVVPMQKAQKDIEGIFKSRDMLLTVIDLASYLGLPPSQNPGRDIFIITRFNNATLHSMSIQLWELTASPGRKSKSLIVSSMAVRMV